jgi:predicted SAM-dependent methyltransferase
MGRLYTRNVQRFPENVQYGDIVKGLPIPDASCKGIYCSHVLEHLALDDFRVALRHSHAYLRSGGVFRLVVPDLEKLAKGYLADSSPDAAYHFMRSSFLGKERRATSLSAIISKWFGNSDHLWMWDEKSMRGELLARGFREIRRAAFGDALDARFTDVEQAERFEGALAMECKK